MGLDKRTVTGDAEQRGAGIWIDYEDAEDVAFKLAYLGNDDYRDYISERMSKARRGRRDIPTERERAIVIQGLVKFIVKDWRGITDNGAAYECTPENIKALLNESAVVRDWVITESNNLENFGGTQKDEEDDTPVGELKSGPPVDAQVG